MAFSAKLTQNAGKEMLIIFPYRRQVRFGGPGDDRESDYNNCKGYALGILSGERLMLAKPDGGQWHNYNIVLPFKRHAVWGFDNHYDTSELPGVGPMTLVGHCFHGIGAPAANSLMRSIIKEKGSDVSTFIGDEITEHWRKLPVVSIDRIRTALNAATEKERIMGEHI